MKIKLFSLEGKSIADFEASDGPHAGDLYVVRKPTATEICEAVYEVVCFRRIVQEENLEIGRWRYFIEAYVQPLNDGTTK